MNRIINWIVAICCVGILMTSLGAVGTCGRERARETICVSNLRNLLDAWLTYPDDHDGKLVFATPSSNIQSSWVFPPKQYVLEDRLEGIRQGALYPYVNSLSAYHCPSDLTLHDPNQGKFLSYSIAHGLNGSNSSHSWGIHPVQTYTEIQAPAKGYVFVETTDPRGYNMGSWVLNMQTSGWFDPVAAWHREGMNLGFADGHVVRRPWVDASTIDFGLLAESASPNFQFAPPIPEDEGEDFAYMLRGYIRGE
jgi:prepilin-type processing-associated H-X9-DG protein